MGKRFGAQFCVSPGSEKTKHVRQKHASQALFHTFAKPYRWGWIEMIRRDLLTQRVQAMLRKNYRACDHNFIDVLRTKFTFRKHGLYRLARECSRVFNVINFFLAEQSGDFAVFHQANRSIMPGLYTKKLHKHTPINVSFPPHGVRKRQGAGVAGENRGSLRPAHVRG